MPSRKVSKAKRAPRRRRAARKGRSGKKDSTGGMRKVYRYKFALGSQVLYGKLDAVNSVDWAAAPAGQVPFKAANMAIMSGTNGFPNFIDVSLSCTNALTDIANIGAFTVLYDQYKITKVYCEVEYLSNIAAANANGLMPTVYYWIDRDDAVVPGGLAQILGKQGIKKWHPTASNSRKVISYTPAQKVGVQNAFPSTGTGVSLGGVLSKPMWLDCTQGMVPGFALKMVVVDFFSPGSAGCNNAFRFNWKYDIAFRSPLICT